MNISIGIEKRNVLIPDAFMDINSEYLPNLLTVNNVASNIPTGINNFSISGIKYI